MEEKADIDMRKSLLIQIYMNMASVYMQLNHYSLAYNAINDALQLSAKVSQANLRKAQSLVFNKNCTFEELTEAK
jgi:cytochrome c-type biogenesis protein CcmH/NrfG